MFSLVKTLSCINAQQFPVKRFAVGRWAKLIVLLSVYLLMSSHSAVKNTIRVNNAVTSHKQSNPCGALRNTRQNPVPGTVRPAPGRVNARLHFFFLSSFGYGGFGRALERLDQCFYTDQRKRRSEEESLQHSSCLKRNGSGPAIPNLNDRKAGRVEAEAEVHPSPEMTAIFSTKWENSERNP